MKTFLSILFVNVVLISALSASGDPVRVVTIMENKTVTVTTSESDAELFLSAVFNEGQNRFEFNTGKEINFVQIFNSEGQMEMQLPAMSKNIKLGMSLFEKGEYKLGFIVKGTSDIQFTNVTIN
ncbi:hypothetical protein N9L92_03595 [Saprospiraceae bacterium]|nr:hypothetical protein [Saprospiraceae bacterium]